MKIGKLIKMCSNGILTGAVTQLGYNLGIWPPFTVCTETDVTANLEGVDMCGPNDDTVMRSCQIGVSCSKLANS